MLAAALHIIAHRLSGRVAYFAVDVIEAASEQGKPLRDIRTVPPILRRLPRAIGERFGNTRSMANAMTSHSGDAISKTLTFTLVSGEEVARVTLLLTRTDAHSEHSTIGRARCIVLESDGAEPDVPAAGGGPSAAVALPRARFQAELRGIVPASICGGTYCPVFCIFAYRDGRPPTGFEIDADQRFTLEIADDAASVDAGPSISAFA